MNCDVDYWLKGNWRLKNGMTKNTTVKTRFRKKDIVVTVYSFTVSIYFFLIHMHTNKHKHLSKKKLKDFLYFFLILAHMWCITANEGDCNFENCCQPLQQQTSLFIPLWHISVLHHSTTHCLELPAEAQAGPHSSSWPIGSPGWPTLPSQQQATEWFHWRTFIYVSYSLWMWK